jgi:AraC-like DNA-binding protein
MPSIPTRLTPPIEPPDAGPPFPALATLILLPPPPDLAPVVEYVWQLVLAGDAPTGACWRVVVDGYVDLTIRTPLDAEPLEAVRATPWSVAARRAAVEYVAASPGVVCGAATAARALPMTRPLLLTGARFRMGTAPDLLRNAPTGLVDGAQALTDVLDGRAARAVWGAREDDVPHHVTGYGCGGPERPDPPAVERVLRAVARASVVAAVRRLVARLPPRPLHDTVDPRVRGALTLLDRASTDGSTDGSTDAGAARVAWVARELAVSKRTLERAFADRLGFAPRAYQRLRRVGTVAEWIERQATATAPRRRALAGARTATLSDLAYRAGYADHAHMTREFGRVMGVAPSTYRCEARAAALARRLGAVAFDRPTPLGIVGRHSTADD